MLTKMPSQKKELWTNRMKFGSLNIKYLRRKKHRENENCSHPGNDTCFTYENNAPCHSSSQSLCLFIKSKSWIKRILCCSRSSLQLNIFLPLDISSITLPTNMKYLFLVTEKCARDIRYSYHPELQEFKLIIN